jgi:hypothetical protein
MPKIFISYRRDDSAAMAGRIYDWLQAHFGQECVFMDIEVIPVGVDVRDYLGEAVSGCNVLLTVIGDRWLKCRRHGRRRLDDPRDFVRIEIEAALARDIPVIPVLIGRAPMPSEQDLPPSLAALAYRNGVHVDSGRDFRAHVNRLISGIDKLLATVTSEASP